MTFEIETGVPLIPRKGGIENNVSEALRRLAASSVGSSVFLDGADPKSLNTLCLRVGKRGWYAIRKVSGGARVWKTAEPTVSA